MDIESLRNYCLSKAGVTGSFPFGADTLVFKVGGKIFLLTNLYSSPVSFNVKCDPGKALEWRERYHSVSPGYHMNKKHWNTVTIDGSINHELLIDMIDDSYNLVVNTLQRDKRP